MKTTLIIFLALASSAFARIGETEAQIEKRYGPPVPAANPVADRKVYKFKGFTINVTFKQGKSFEELIWKSDVLVMAAPVVDGLLAANAPSGTTWELSGPDIWKRSDGRAIAQILAGMLSIQTLANGEWERAVRMADKIEHSETQGF